MRLSTFRLVAFAALALALAGCDKCGNRIKFKAPTLPSLCGDDAGPAR